MTTQGEITDSQQPGRRKTKIARTPGRKGAKKVTKENVLITCSPLRGHNVR